jgi:hypothetical protein
VAINIPIFSSLDTKGFDRAKKEFQSLEGFGAKAGYIVKNAMLPIAAAAGTVAAGLGLAAKAAAEDEKSQAQLERQLRASIGATDAQIAAMGDYVDQTQLSLGVTDDLVRAGLGTLIRATKDATKAQDLMNLAMDISAATGKDLESVSLALAKGYGGQLTALKKLGIPLDENTVKTKDFNAATRQLTDTFGGAAQANANTFSGRVERLKIRFDEMVESVGYKVLPTLTDLVDNITELVDAFGEGGAAGALRAFRGQMQDLTRSNDGTINSFGTLINALITVRNAVAHVLNAFIRLYNVIPILDDIPTINTLDQLGTNLGDFYKAFSGATQAAEAQRKLNNYMGPVAARNIDALSQYQEAYKEQLRQTVDTEDAMTKASGGSSKKLKEKKKDLDDATKAAKAYADAVAGAIEKVRDQFSPALKDANDRLTDAQGIYNEYYKSIRGGITGIMDIGTAWSEAANSEGAKTFFGVLKDQAAKAQTLAQNLETLIGKGLDDPTLLQSILSQGAETGLAITDAILAGGEQGLADISSWTTATAKAADSVAKLSADKWFKAGVDQAQAVVNGINSLIADTEFALKFVVSVEGAQQLEGMFGANAATVLAGGTAAPMFNPAEYSAAAFMALGQPAGGTGNVQSMSVNVNAGLVSTPDQIGQQIIEAILRSQRKSGAVFAPA